MKKYQDELVVAAQDLEALRRDTHSKDFAAAISGVEGRLIEVADEIATDHHLFARIQYGAIKALYELLEGDTCTHVQQQKASYGLEALRLFWDMGDGQGPWLLTAEDIALVKNLLGE